MSFAEWHSTYGAGGRPIGLYPPQPRAAITEARRKVSVHHCTGCPACRDGFEAPTPCPHPPGECPPSSPCPGRREAREWQKEHVCHAHPLPQRPRSSAHRWSRAEDRLLRQNTNMGDEALARILGRPAASVKNRRTPHRRSNTEGGQD